MTAAVEMRLGRGGTYFYCLEPTRLLDLVVDDWLVLVDALVSSAGEDHVLEAEERDTGHIEKVKRKRNQL